ncbi:MAG: hypothetical protein KGH78_04355 [Candidatus Micrarchaeota archaeon]|nr:hypothetical protein [Candidatus Micrarchaeota archaeon]
MDDEDDDEEYGDDETRPPAPPPSPMPFFPKPISKPQKLDAKSMLSLVKRR